MGAGPSDGGQWRDVAHKFFGCGDDPGRIDTQKVECVRMIPQVGQDAADDVNDRVSAARKGQVGKARLFLGCQLSPTKLDLVKDAEEVIPGLQLCLFQPVHDVGLKTLAHRLAVTIVKDVKSPADPLGRLALWDA